MVEEAEVQETTKLLEVISVTDSEVSTSGGGCVVSPSDVSTRNRARGACESFRACVRALLADGSSSVLTGARGRGEIKACDLTTSVGQDADQLTLVGDGRTQPTDGVGVQVARDGHLCPWRTCVFLPGTEAR